MFNSLARIFKFWILSDSKPRTMNHDAFLQIIDSFNTLETSALLRDLENAILFSEDDPEITLNRFMVPTVTHCKDTSSSSPQHECLILRLTDTLGSELRDLFMILERTASNKLVPSSYFMTHSDSLSILETIVQALRDLPECFRPNSNDSPPPIDELESTAGSTVSSPNASSRNLSFLDTASLSAVNVVGASMSSVSTDYHADDRFVGGKHLETYALYSHNIQQIACNSLSLFDLVVLADTVHNHNPLYSIFKSQCFWFCSIICRIISREYDCNSATPTEPLQDENIRIPPNEYLPKFGGRCFGGLLVSVVEEAVIEVVLSNFKRNRRERMENVRL